MAEDGGSSSWGRVFTSTNSTSRVTAVAVGSCGIVLVAVGGGGDRGGNMDGGGGSGYVTWKAIPIKASMTLEVEVGSTGFGSLVRGGELLLEAPPGEPGEDRGDGGAGYSGGGGAGFGDGGTGGGDGEAGMAGAGSVGSGGHGSRGPALEDIPILDFILR